MAIELKHFLLVPIIMMFGVSPVYYRYYGVDLQLILTGVSGLIFFSKFVVGVKSFNLGKKLNVAALLIFVLPFFSLLWAQDKKIALEGLIPYSVVVYFLFVVNGLRSLTLRDLLLIVSIAVMLVAVAGVCVSYLFPGLGVQQTGQYIGDAWIGLFDHKNSYSRMLGVGILASITYLCFFEGYRLLLTLNIFFLFGCLWLSRSGTVLIAVTALAILVLSMKGGGGRRIVKYFPLICCALVFLGPIVVIFDQLLALVLDVLGRAEYERSTIEVRAHLWGEVIQGVIARPIFGYGLGGFWGSDGRVLSVAGDTSLEWVPMQAHNGYLELMLSFGLVGLGCFIFYLRELNRLVNRVRGVSYLKGTVIFTMFYLIINNTYAAFFTQIALPWFMVASVVFVESREWSDWIDGRARE